MESPVFKKKKKKKKESNYKGSVGENKNQK